MGRAANLYLSSLVCQILLDRLLTAYVTSTWNICILWEEHRPFLISLCVIMLTKVYSSIYWYWYILFKQTIFSVYFSGILPQKDLSRISQRRAWQQEQSVQPHNVELSSPQYPNWHSFILTEQIAWGRAIHRWIIIQEKNYCEPKNQTDGLVIVLLALLLLPINTLFKVTSSLCRVLPTQKPSYYHTWMRLQHNTGMPECSSSLWTLVT